MRQMKIILNYSLITFLLLLFTGCDNDDDSETPIEETADAIIYADFKNDGITQSLTLDTSMTQGPVQIENEVTFTENGTRFSFEFSGVTFIEGSSVYEINKIITQKYEEDEWQLDNENFLGYEPSKSLDIVLVLDVSSSLGDNLQEVKQGAISVLRQIFADNSNVKVAVVKFSRGYVSTQLSSNFTELSQFISNVTIQPNEVLGESNYILENKNETALYEAMLEGIDILKNSNARGQGLITLTDGANNFQENPDNADRQVVVDGLNSSDIRSYTIGFVGNGDGVNDQALEDLAVNGKFSKPSSVAELNQVFTSFSNSVAAVYDLIYNTNNAPFNGAKTFRYLIDLDQIN